MKKQNNKENYLEKIPVKDAKYSWSVDEEDVVVIDVENTGLFNRIAQKLLKKPKVSHIHLDKIGSFVWPLIDGEKDLIKIGELVKEHFEDEAEPLYERLVKYFVVLDNCGFIQWKKDK